ncbi:MAG TPA: hypothetical protein DD390_00325 [Rhodospirillaceae bacterium]|nr:hypothetical protein [Rhodospirillaceae bacterium]MAX61918.1 hypothetical protein [Rhodospirillaceae bacterium]MAX63254.1 hypothetical protein [Rhodospirillaceae bacterium]HBM11118.1 hypothetical protein [Rhodospirillaceae bacterium]|tara:strand:- start:305 stop:799 length:495 start_codon:yes stop_codon:yes gene_type:complete
MAELASIPHRMALLAENARLEAVNMAVHADNRRLRAALGSVKASIEQGGEGGVCCTVWMTDTPSETVCDFIEATLARQPDAATPGRRVSATSSVSALPTPSPRRAIGDTLDDDHLLVNALAEYALLLADWPTVRRWLADKIDCRDPQPELIRLRAKAAVRGLAQ